MQRTGFKKQQPQSSVSQFSLDPGNSGFTNNNYNNNNMKKNNKFNLTAGTFSCFFLSGVESFWLSKRYFPEAGVVFGPVGILRIYSYLLCFMNCNSMTRLLFAQVTNS